MQHDVKQISLRKAKIDDFDFFYSIKSEKSNIYWTGHDKKPDAFSLKIWFEGQINSEKRLIYIIYLNDVKVGYSYLDIITDSIIETEGLEKILESPKTLIDNSYINKKDKVIIEISIGISEVYQNQGLGNFAIETLLKLIKNEYKFFKIICWILENNVTSQKIFKKNSFYPTIDVRNQYIPCDDKTYQMRKYR